MGSPRLTIVIPTVNRASLVRRALDSALAQSYRDLEIIVSNNGSTDDTREILELYRGAPRLRINHIDKTIPVNPHGNLLLDMARGEFFLGLSDDDWLEPNFAEKVIDLFDRRPKVVFVWTGCLMHYADVAAPARVGPEVESGPEFLEAFLAGLRNPCWCAVVTRTADLRSIGHIPTEVICGDMFYWTKLAAKGSVGCVPQTVSHYVCYRDGGNGIAGGASVLSWAEDQEGCVRDIVRTCEASGSKNRRLRGDAERVLARSTSNQFVWQAMRGAHRSSLLRTIPSALPYLRAFPPFHWIRVIAAIAAPRSLLRQRMISEARRRARRAMKRARMP